MFIVFTLLKPKQKSCLWGNCYVGLPLLLIIYECPVVCWCDNVLDLHFDSVHTGVLTLYHTCTSQYFKTFYLIGYILLPYCHFDLRSLEGCKIKLWGCLQLLVYKMFYEWKMECKSIFIHAQYAYIPYQILVPLWIQYYPPISLLGISKCRIAVVVINSIAFTSPSIKHN